MGCGRTFCPRCEQEMIHRDNRHFYESASGLGQVISRDGPRGKLTTGDVDQYVWRLLANGKTVLRQVEQKQTGQQVKWGQSRALRAFDQVIEHAIDCPSSPVRLDATSGVYVLCGPVYPEMASRRKVLLGPQKLWNPRKGDAGGWVDLPTQADVFAWLMSTEGGP